MTACYVSHLFGDHSLWDRRQYSGVLCLHELYAAELATQADVVLLASLQYYHEAPIHFPPTFKLQPRTTRYSEQRIPSWTDRILWKVRSESTSNGGARTTSNGGASSTTCHVQGAGGPIAVSVKHTYYQSVPECDSSDHRPVVAGFDLMMAAEGNVAAALVSDGGAGGAGKESVLSKASRCTIM